MKTVDKNQYSNNYLIILTIISWVNIIKIIIKTYIDIGIYKDYLHIIKILLVITVYILTAVEINTSNNHLITLNIN